MASNSPSDIKLYSFVALEMGPKSEKWISLVDRIEIFPQVAP